MNSTKEMHQEKLEDGEEAYYKTGIAFSSKLL